MAVERNGRSDEYRTEVERNGAKEFLEKYWPVITVAATLGGAALFLTAKYLADRKKTKPSVREELEVVGDEALIHPDETSILVEGSQAVAEVAGTREVIRAVEELAGEIGDEKVLEMLSTISGIASVKKINK